MSDPVELAKKLRQDLEKTEEFKNYFHLKELIENSEELKELRTSIARLNSQNKFEEANALKKIYDSNPLVNNFYQAKQEISEILNQIKNMISD